ncbi:MAG: zinc-binding alcohol dehydrogenase family protein [Nevskia sp.]|nr:zinc-binding alcohol dehydrogenase family protein [Nevskia sp.]
MMKALRFDRTGNLDALSLEQVPSPRPQPDEVVVEVCAAGLNPSDVKNVLGRFPYTTLPRTPGRDFAGVVVDGPAELIGEEVWGTGKEFGFVRDGSHAERIAVPLDGIAPKPSLLTFAQAASCGVPYTTAWDALERGGLVPGDGLVVIGASGSVGRAALALGRWCGAQVIGAVRRPAQVEQLAAEGFESILLGERDDLSAAVRRHYPAGADLIFDTTGHWLGPSVAALAEFGRIAVISAPNDGLAELPLLELYRRGGSIVGVNSLLYDSRACAPMLDRFSIAFATGLLPPPPAPRERPLSEALMAYREVAAGVGDKIVFVNG